MASGNFQYCLAIVLKSEGGFVLDDGTGVGATNLGVTQKTLSSWLGRPATVQDVRDLTSSAVAPIYDKLFWGASHCEYLPTGVDLMVFDEGVNEGVGTANKHLQQAISVPDDGLIGPVTINATLRTAPASLITELAGIRIAYYKTLKHFPTDGDGWIARVERTEQVASGMAQEKTPTD